jgi:hypothetical protein
MNMRDLMRLVEGDVVPFKAKAPQWATDSSGISTKLFSMHDMLDDDEPPEPLESLAVERNYDTQTWIVGARWDDWHREFTPMDLNRMLKLRPGEEFEAIDRDRLPQAGYPPPRWMVKRVADHFLLGFTHWSTKRDDAGQDHHSCEFGWKRYALPVHDLTVMQQQLRAKLTSASGAGHRPSVP